MGIGRSPLLDALDIEKPQLRLNGTYYEYDGRSNIITSSRPQGQEQHKRDKGLCRLIGPTTIILIGTNWTINIVGVRILRASLSRATPQKRY